MSRVVRRFSSVTIGHILMGKWGLVITKGKMRKLRLCDQHNQSVGGDGVIFKTKNYNMKGENKKMNNKFKRALSSVLAFIMLCSCVCVMNVANVFAANATYIVTTTQFGDSHSNGKYYDLQITDDSGATGVSDNPVSSDNGGFYFLQDGSGAAFGKESSAETVDGLSLQYYIKNGTNGKGAITFYAEAGDTIKVYYKPSSTSTKVAFSQSVSNNAITNTLATSETASSTSDIISFLYTATKSGVYYVGCAVDKAQFYAVTTVPSGNQLSTYSVSGKSNMPNTTITINGTDVTTDASGDWTYTISAYTAPFAVGSELSVSLLNYTADDITLSAGTNDKSFNGGTITFTKVEALDVDEAVGEVSLLKQSSYDDGAVISKYFTVNGADVEKNDSYIALKGNGIKFTTKTPLKVSIKCSSTSTNNESVLYVKNSAGTDVYTNTNIKGKTSEADYVVVSYKLPADTYEIYVPSDASRVTRLMSVKFEEPVDSTITTTASDSAKPAILVTAAKDAWYAIAVIASGSKTTLEKIAIDNVDTNTVYNSVTIGGTSYTAKDFGGSEDDYVFAVQGDGAPDDTATATEVQDNLTVTYTNVTTE
jgi:hypothetical protein